MSEFVLVVPEGWIEIESPDLIMSEESWINATRGEVTEALKGVGVIGEDGTAALDHRVFRDGGVLRLWVRLGPEQ